MGMVTMVLAGLALAQTPADHWKTVNTENFRVHYPVQATAWGLDAAGQLEAIRERVIDEVGWAPDRTMDVLVVDPVSQANGSAWPFTAAPRMLLWVTPPPASSSIGHYRSWGELLLTHEYAHMVHLLRDGRNPWERRLQSLIGVGPVPRKAPRWCIEGYATVVEARLSGFGRPNADFRALLLRRLAEGGRLPAYGELNAFQRFYGGSFAYFVGSAYLEWLEARAGRGSLRDLWARMTAREARSFDEAFQGVFGDPPSVLYARFTAEVTAEALRIEALRPVDPDTLWNDTRWYTAAPAASPDGSMLAAVVARQAKPSNLVIWSTGTDTEAEAKREERREEQLKADPEDVLAVDPKHPPREELHRRRFVTRAAVEPRWLPSGEAVLFSAWQRDATGRVRPDLYLWHPQTGEERRVTRGADLRSADPFPNEREALAVRQDWGRNQLVIVDLESGGVEPLMEARLDVVYDQPRVAPTGDRVAWLEHRGGGWSVVVHDEARRGRWRIAGTPGGPIPTHLAWSPDGGSLYATMGMDGFVEVHEVWGVDGARGQLSRTRGGALAPTATEDALFFLSMDPDGYEIHRLGLDAVQADVAIDGLAPTVRPAVEPAPEVPAQQETVETAYGLGRTELRALIGGTWSPSQGAVEAGLRAGDLIGRRDLLLMGSYGDDTGVTGGLVAGTYRGLPVALTLQGFAASERPEVMHRYGVLGTVSSAVQGQVFALDWRVGGFHDRPFADRVTGEDPALPAEAVLLVLQERSVAYAEVDLAWLEGRQAWLAGDLRFRGQVGSGPRLSEGRTRLWAGRGTRLGLSYTLGHGEDGMDGYRLGGVSSSVLPDDWEWERIAAPVFALGSARGTNRESARVTLEQGGVLDLFAERHRLADQLSALGAHGSTAVGIDVHFENPAEPFLRLPDTGIHAGLGCRIEDPVNGFDEDPCTALDDYAFWASLQWSL